MRQMESLVRLEKEDKKEKKKVTKRNPRQIRKEGCKSLYLVDFRVWESCTLLVRLLVTWPCPKNEWPPPLFPTHCL